MRRILVLIIFLFLIITFNGCTVQKKKGEVSKLGKIYHNTTALYNGYFNADVIMQEAEYTLVSQYQDNYNKLLPLYPYTEASNANTVAASLDKAIEKVSIVATIHDPSQWVDDCYVLLGKAQYLKQDYETAEKTFEFFADEFDPLNKNRSRLKKQTQKKKTPRAKSTKRPTKTKAPKKTASKTKKKKTSTKKKKPSSKKRKPGTKKRDPKETSSVSKTETETSTTNGETPKESESVQNPVNVKPQSVVSTAEKDGMFGHKPVYQEGLLWLARTYIHRERYSLADYYINKVMGDSNTPKDVKKEIPVVKAFYHIKKKEYNDAIQSLQQAIELSTDKYEKARFTFIIAQLHQSVGRQDKAFEAYNEVIKMHPEYEMEFNAQLNLSKAAWASGQESAKSSLDRLEKMAKEEKNFDYRDQIFFMMGTINLKLKERDLAIENFRESIKYNVGNSAQSAETYYALATYFFEEEEYDNAKFHYDSTLISLPKLDERYAEVLNRSENLKDIALNIQVIKLQDSLLRVSNMSPEKQREIAANIKKKNELSAQPKSKLSNGPGFASAVAVSGTPVSGVGANKSNFFAYDINKIRRGQNEFRKKWGSRALEDDWRRSNKPSSEITQNTTSEEIAKKMTDEEVKDILKNVPFTPKDKALALNKIEEAHFELGKLYRQKLNQYEKSVQSLETLFERNDNSVFKLEAYYYAYLSYLDLNNVAKANYYLDKLKTEFPDSKYTLSIIDPNYAATQLNEAKKVERNYDKAYVYFQNNQYQESKDLLEELGNEDPLKTKGLLAKIDLLKAMCEGNLQGQDEYIIALNYVVKKHPNTPEQARANEILRFIKGDTQAFDPILYTENTEEFTVEEDKLHYVLVVLFTSSSKDMTSSKIDISAFNQKKYNDAKLKISSIFLNKDDGSQIILIRKFDDMTTAMDYFKDSQANGEEFLKGGDFKYEVFAVTQKSYREIVKQKSVNAYRVFFENNYLK